LRDFVILLRSTEIVLCISHLWGTSQLSFSSLVVSVDTYVDRIAYCHSASTNKLMNN